MTRLYTTTLFVLFLALTTSAQKYLPWETQFANQEEQDEWTEYRMGATDFFNWSFPGIPDSYPSHDYPVGASSTDTTTDWLVSPELYFHSSAEVSMKVNRFSLITIAPEDRFELWMSTGSPDPADGDFSLVVDLTEFGSNGIWTDTTGIVTSDTGMGYLALVYEATNNWYTIAVDSMVITPDEPLDTLTGTSSIASKDRSLEVWPNPATNQLQVQWHGDASWSMTLSNLQGQIVRSSEFLNGNVHQADVSDLPKGVYVLHAFDETSRFSETVVIE